MEMNGPGDREKSDGPWNYRVFARRTGRRSPGRALDEKRRRRSPQHRASVRARRPQRQIPRGHTVPELLIAAAGGVGVVAAAAALWLESSRRMGRRCFARLLALAVASSVFSVLAWTATAIARITPLPLTWAFVVTL